MLVTTCWLPDILCGQACRLNPESGYFVLRSSWFTLHVAECFVASGEQFVRRTVEGSSRSAGSTSSSTEHQEMPAKGSLSFSIIRWTMYKLHLAHHDTHDIVVTWRDVKWNVGFSSWMRIRNCKSWSLRYWVVLLLVLSAGQTSLSCWTCTEVTELLNCLNRYVKLTYRFN